MKKLNNKGMTIVEILVCFVLVVAISASLFKTLNNYRSKQQLESDRSQIIKYKNLLTKEIQTDLITKNVIDANIEGPISEDSNERKTKYIITFTFKDNSSKQLIITKHLAAYSIETGTDDEIITDIPKSQDIDDKFIISYGGINYKLPNLGSYENPNGKTVYDFKINNIDINKDNNILSIYIGFYHHEFGTRYAIDIVCPINYQ